MSAGGSAIERVRVCVGVCVKKKQADAHVPEKQPGGERGADHQRQTAVITLT